MNDMVKKAAVKYAVNLLECYGSDLSLDFLKFILSLLSFQEFKVVDELLCSKTRKKRSESNVETVVFSDIYTEKKIRELVNKIKKSNQLDEIINKLTVILTNKSDAGFMLPKVKRLKKILNLSPLECDIIHLAYIAYLDENIKSGEHIPVLDSNYNIYRDSYSFHDIKRHFSVLLGISYEEMVKFLKSRSPLIVNDLIYEDLDIDERLAGYLISDMDCSFIDYLCTKGRKPFYDIHSFQVEEKVVEVAVNILKNVEDARLLIYGPPGTGKTEFAKSLIVSCNKTPYFVKDCDDIYMASAFSLGDKEVVVADEADEMLNEDHPFFRKGLKKGEINQGMDGLNKQCLFICNAIEDIDASVLRRFTFIIPFRKLSHKEQLTVWRHNVKSLDKFMNKNEAEHYSNKYLLPVGVVSKSASAAVKCCRSKSKRLDYFEIIMDSHNKIINGSVGKKYKASQTFGKEYLNTDTDVDLLTDYVKKYTVRKKAGEEARCSFLFHGAPGTGKTEFAKHIAELTELDSIVLKCSDIKDMYVGNTEKNIRNAFISAHERSAVLIFDEIDSMLYSRGVGMRSWEISAVNEFLAQMDEYRGILICTTNFLNALDSACIRRFDWKVGFNPLNGEQIIKAMSGYFKDIHFEAEDINRSWIGNLTLGDIALVSNRCKVMEADKFKIITLLDTEIRYKRNMAEKRVGF